MVTRELKLRVEIYRTRDNVCFYNTLAEFLDA